MRVEAPTDLPQMAFRDATLADLPAIVAIYNATVASRSVTADLDPVSVESRLAWFRAHAPGRRPLWVVDGPGGLLAWLSFSDFYGRPAYDATVEVSIYLAEEARGKGMGRALLGHAIERAPALGIDTLLGFVFGHNVASLGLFKNLGFALWGTLPGVARLDGIERDLVILGLRLDRATRS